MSCQLSSRRKTTTWYILAPTFQPPAMLIDCMTEVGATNS
jgi:hypothetical protein